MKLAMTSGNRKCADCEYFDDVTSSMFEIKDKGYCTKGYCYGMRDADQKCVVCENKKETDESERTN